ncbi:MAG: deoxyribonuclease V [Desulfobacteraceae bacterium]|jgi:deoxyribonuclease V
MKTRQLHPWKVTPKEAIDIQKRLKPRLRLKKLSRDLQYVAGTDVSSSKKSNTIWAGVVVLRYPDLVSVEEKWFKAKTDFPYVPGLLSFREIPVLLQALKRLEISPDLILCDGQGIAHPRGLGLASHLGLLVDRPTIGCAKNRLVGEFSEVGRKKGSYTYLWHKGHVIGAVARTRTGVKPLFVSPGNRVTLEESLKIAFRCCKKYRVPQPTRLAHLLVNVLRSREGS